MTLEERIQRALAEVRPYLENDCSVNHTTMKLGVENSIRSHAPEIEEVVALDYGA